MEQNISTHISIIFNNEDGFLFLVSIGRNGKWMFILLIFFLFSDLAWGIPFSKGNSILKKAPCLGLFPA